MRTRIIHHQDTLASVPLLKKNAHVEMRKLRLGRGVLKKKLPKKNVTHTSSVTTVNSVFPKKRVGSASSVT